MAQIQVKDLSKRFQVKKNKNFLRNVFFPAYREVSAVKNINFEIKEGESVAFLGPNGAGKTTTIKMLSGLIYPSNGMVDIIGFTPFDRKQDFLMQIGLVMGNKSGMNWDLTANQSLELLKQIYSISDSEFKSRIEKLTELLEVQDLLDTQIRKLSLGERMKMEIIGGILHNPKILFLDEPTIGLDILAKQKIRKFLRQIQKESNITILLTSHEIGDIEEVCDRVIVINAGAIVFDDSIDKLSARYANHKFVKVFFKEKPELLSFSVASEAVKENENSVVFKLDSRDLQSFLAEVMQKHKIEDIDITSTPLEEIISDIFRGGT